MKKFDLQYNSANQQFRDALILCGILKLTLILLTIDCIDKKIKRPKKSYNLEY